MCVCLCVCEGKINQNIINEIEWTQKLPQARSKLTSHIKTQFSKAWLYGRIARELLPPPPPSVYHVVSEMPMYSLIDLYLQ
jgi:hypothetical protein